MSDRENYYAEEIVGIWHDGKIFCLHCAGAERLKAVLPKHRIRRADVEDGDFNICELCGKPLTWE